MTTPRTLLVIEDDIKIADLIRLYAEPEGFRVVHCDRGDEGLLAAQNSTPDLILLDRMLPEMEGFEILKTLRKTSNTPIILVTARADEMEKILGLELGADDYLAKPFSPKELMARIKAVLRRTTGKTETTEDPIQLKDLVIVPSSFTAHHHGKLLKLSRLEFKLLHTLAAHPERTFSREQLMDALYDSKALVFDRTIDAHIKNLRKKLEDNPKKPAYIESIFGIGYRFKNDS